MSKRVAVIVSGDRHGQGPEWNRAVFHVLLNAIIDTEWSVVIHGAAPGIDAMAGDIGRAHANAVIPMPAQWTTLGKAAGPHRNRLMLNALLALRDVGYEVAILAFHDDLESSRGTKNMVGMARGAHVPVKVYGSDGRERG
jgi:hypothetical protein